jgi:hypothetical protein
MPGSSREKPKAEMRELAPHFRITVAKFRPYFLCEDKSTYSNIAKNFAWRAFQLKQSDHRPQGERKEMAIRSW